MTNTNLKKVTDMAWKELGDCLRNPCDEIEEEYARDEPVPTPPATATTIRPFAYEENEDEENFSYLLGIDDCAFYDTLAAFNQEA